MSRTHARTLDQFYTDPALAAELVGHLLSWLNRQGVVATYFLEPSAGEGAFLDALIHAGVDAVVDGVDLDPKHSRVRQGDFFDEVVPCGAIVFGNPPFGKNAMLAVRFFNHAAQTASVIAFIVPRTFEKSSVQNRLDSRFELASEVAIDPNSFHFEGERVSVPCVFQVWARLPEGQRRPVISAPTTHPDFHFLKSPDGAGFAFQRVGVAAGRTKALDAKHLAPPSHYFLAPRPGLSADVLRARLDSIDWSPIKQRTAGNPSISKGELVAAYSTVLAAEKAGTSASDYSRE